MNLLPLYVATLGHSALLHPTLPPRQPSELTSRPDISAETGTHVTIGPRDVIQGEEVPSHAAEKIAASEAERGGKSASRDYVGTSYSQGQTVAKLETREDMFACASVDIGCKDAGEAHPDCRGANVAGISPRDIQSLKESFPDNKIRIENDAQHDCSKRPDVSNVEGESRSNNDQPKKRNKQFDEGNRLFAAKEYSLAEACFNAALEADPTNLAILGNLSVCLGKLKQYEKARDVAREMVAINSRFAKGHFRLAQALHSLGDAKAAFESSARASRLQPSERPYSDFSKALGDKLDATTRDSILKEIDGYLLGTDNLDNVFAQRRLPVTILSGFLGSGKTTLLTRILNNTRGLRVAVLVNDMSDVLIDAETIRRDTKTTEIVELANGCICCTLREDLVREVAAIASTPSNKFDYLVIESTGISEPMPVAVAFSLENVAGGESLAKVCRLDTMVTVVDASQFNEIVRGSTRLRDINLQVNQEDERTVADLLVDQVEFANVVIINKCDLSSNVDQVQRMVKTLNPSVKVFQTTKCEEIPLDDILNTKLFDLDKSSSMAGWKQELLRPHLSESLEYGFTCFTFRYPSESLVGFNARALSHVLSGDRLLREFNVIRSKGFLFIVEDDRFVLEWASAGPNSSLKCAGFWHAAIEKEGASESPSNDRKLELVFMGIDLKRKALEAELERCLVVYSLDGSARQPTPEAIGLEWYTHIGFDFLYSKMGKERQFSKGALKKEITRLDQIRKRMEELSSLERDLNDEEMMEATRLAQEFKSLRASQS